MKNLTAVIRPFWIIISISIIFISLYFVQQTIAAEDSNLQTFISKQLTKRQIRKYLRQSSNVKSLKSDATLKFVYEPAGQEAGEDQSIDLDATLDMSSNSILNFLKYGDEKFQVSMKANGKISGETISFDGELRMVNETIYGIISALPQSILEESPELADKQGKWYSYKIKNMQEFRKLFSNTSNSKVNAMLSDAELDKLIDLLHDDVIQKRYTKTNYQTPDGIAATCLNFKYTGAQFYQLVLRLQQMSEYAQTQSEDVDQQLYDALKNLAFTICSDSEFKNIYKTTFALLVESEEFGKTLVEFEQQNYNHNQDLNVLAPTNAESLDAQIDSQIAGSDLDLSQVESGILQMNSVTTECRNLGGQQFPDVTENFNEYDSIIYSKDNGIIKGYSDGCFRPYNEITREQLIAILIRGKHTAAEIQACTDIAYPDVNMVNKQKSEICLAKKLNYVSGYSDGGFRPSTNITIEEAAKMIANVYGINNTAVDNSQYEFNSYMTSLTEKNALPDVLGCKGDMALRADITEIIYRLKTNNSSKQYSSLDELKSC